MEELRILIKKFKQGNVDDYYKILKRFDPTIKKYTRLLYKDEKEDVYSEMALAIYEALLKINYYSEEGKCVIYLTNALRNRFLELYRKSRNRYDHEQNYDNDFFINHTSMNVNMNNVITEVDMHNIISNYGDRQSNIFYSILIEELTDTEISHKFKISRQYANKLRKKLYLILKENYFNH